MLDSYLQSCCSLTGMVLHLDLLNYGEAVDRLNDCLLLLRFFTFILLNTALQLSVCAPFLGLSQPGQMSAACSLKSQ